MSFSPQNNRTLGIEVLSTLLTNATKTKNSRKAQLMADCPFCGKSKHFFINVQKGHPKENQWDCKKCGETGGLMKLLRKLDKLYLIESDSSAVNIAMGVKKIVENNENRSLDIILPSRKMPIGFQRVFDDPYLNSRKFQPTDYQEHPSGYTYWKRIYQGYVLIGVVNEGEVKGFLGRWTGKDSDNRPKYLNSPNTDFAGLLFNVDAINSNTRIAIAVEGAFDTISTQNEMELYAQDETKVVGTFGKKISEYQLYILKKKGIETLIFLYDAKDAIDDLKKYMFQAKKYFDVYAAIEMTGDPGSWNKAVFQRIMTNLRTPEQIWIDKLNPKRLKV